MSELIACQEGPAIENETTTWVPPHTPDGADRGNFAECVTFYPPIAEYPEPPTVSENPVTVQPEAPQELAETGAFDPLQVVVFAVILVLAGVATVVTRWKSGGY